ncbi:MAG: hypothetical protein HFH48_05960 [Lachnospiraceae bacterium]|nr:hypothetical protein [Lachnospiraceae bacterium]
MEVKAVGINPCISKADFYVIFRKISRIFLLFGSGNGDKNREKENCVVRFPICVV